MNAGLRHAECLFLIESACADEDRKKIKGESSLCLSRRTSAHVVRGKLTKTVAVNRTKFSRMTRGFGRVGRTGPPSNAGKPAGRANTFLKLASSGDVSFRAELSNSFTPLTSSQRPAKTRRACYIWSRATQPCSGKKLRDFVYYCNEQQSVENPIFIARNYRLRRGPACHGAELAASDWQGLAISKESESGQWKPSGRWQRL